MDLEVVYKAHVENVGEVMRLLRRQRIQPSQLDDPDTTNLHVGKGRYLVRIAVPQEQVEKAAEVLRQWEDCSKGPVEEYARKLRSQVLLAFLVAAIVGFGMILLGKFDMEDIYVLFLVWLGSFVLIANRGSVKDVLRKLINYRDPY